MIAHPDASGAHVTIDPTPFLSTIVATSAALVTIIGGLLVAKFVGLDADQRTTRKVLAARVSGSNSLAAEPRRRGTRSSAGMPRTSFRRRKSSTRSWIEVSCHRRI